MPEATSIGSHVTALGPTETLPPYWYTDPAIFEREREHIFARSWLYACHLDQLAGAGSFFTFSVAGIPIVVTRSDGEEIHAFVNVCRHRGTIVATGKGCRQTLQCPYHAWTYALNGTLISAPRSDTDPSFEREDYGLIPLRVERWGPLVFVNLDLAAAPLSSVLGTLPDVVAASGIDFSRLRFRARLAYGQEMDLRANWKVVIENGLECYHCPINHPGLSRVIHVEEDSFTLFAEDYVSVQRGPARPLLTTHDVGGATYDPRGEVTASQVFHVWPYFTLNTWPGRENMYILLFVPISVDRTRVLTDWFFSDDVSDDEARGMIEFLNEVGREDQTVVELAHEGLSAALAPPGRLLPKSEQLIHWFQRLVCQSLEQSSFQSHPVRKPVA